MTAVGHRHGSFSNVYKHMCYSQRFAQQTGRIQEAVLNLDKRMGPVHINQPDEVFSIVAFCLS